MNDSSMMLNPNLNPFSKLPTEMASAFDKMIQQFEIISKTVKIMDQRIATAESQIEGLYGMRKIQNELNNENGQEYNENVDNNYIPENEYNNNNYNGNMNQNNNLVNENNMNNQQLIENNNNMNNEMMENNNNNNEIIENNENNNQIVENEINHNQINNNNMILSNNNNINQINNNMTANFNGTITGLQASIGDLDINVNDARNIFNQNLGNTNLNMENHEDLNQNLNSNVNPIGSGEIIPEQAEGMNNDNNQNGEENK
jgi:hypothetical protein